MSPSNENDDEIFYRETNVAFRKGGEGARLIIPGINGHSNERQTCPGGEN